MATATETFWTLKLSDIINFLILLATIFAIYFGPIRAVEISRRNDEIREAARRKREIFSSLMRTRQVRVDPSHVWALNLVQLEFADYDDVLRAHRDYISTLSEAMPQPGPALDAFIARRTDRFFDLLHAIAKALGMNFDKRDLERVAYVPSGWVSEQDEIALFRRALIDVLLGRRALPVASFQPTPPNLYPPAPGASKPPASEPPTAGG
jgi:hypothetical protein